VKTCLRSFAAVALVLAAAQAALGQTAPLPAVIGTEAQADRLENLARKTGDPLIPTCRFEGARCGYIDRDGKTVIAPAFEWVDRFASDRALVRSGGKYGAIDATGRFAVAATYDSMSPFHRGLAVVLVGDRLGIVDQDGQQVLPAEHGLIVRIADHAYLVAEPPYANRGRQPSSLGDALGRMHRYAYGKRWGVVANGGAWIVRPTFAQVQALSDELNGLFWAADSAGMTARWQLMGADGAPLTKELFDHVQQIQAGQDRAIVQRGGRWGAINGKGEIAIDLKFDWLGYFRDGWAPYRLAGREGRIDRNGNVLSDTTAQPSPLSPSRDAKFGAVVDGKTLYTDQAGTVLLGTNHPKCPDGRHLRFAEQRWTIMTADERPAPDVAFEYVDLVCTGHSIVKHDGKWGFISVDGKLLTDRYFDRANAFHEGIATITDQGLWAVIGEDGSILLGPLKLARGTAIGGNGEYDLEFEEGFRKLDKDLVTELAKNPDVLTQRLAPRLPWSEGLAAQFDDKTGKWGFVGPEKKFVIAPQFDAVSGFKDGAAWAAFPDRREWCQIDKAGQIKAGTQCHCNQPIVIVEHYIPPANADCYDDGVRIVHGFPAIRGMAN